MLQIFRARIGSLRKALKSRADLVFIDGPHALTATDDSLAAEAGAASANQRAWWSWQARCAAHRALFCFVHLDVHTAREQPHY